MLHRAYDKNSCASERWKSKTFGRGIRRLWDWLDWIDIAAWDKEHNVLHHYRLGERFDPDVFEFNVEVMRKRNIPRFVKIMSLALGMTAWKWFYYAPSTVKQLFSPKKSNSMSTEFDRLTLFDPIYNPLNKARSKPVDAIVSPL